MQPLIADLGFPEMLILLVVVVLLFGASKLPELARGSGQALRIFKAETRNVDADPVDVTTSPVEGPREAPTAQPVRRPGDHV